MALGTEIVNLIGLYLLNDPLKVAAIAQVAIVQRQGWRLTLVTKLMRILIKVIDSCGVEATGAALDAMHGIALPQQQLCKVAAILAGDACDQGLFFGCSCPPLWLVIATYPW